MAPKTKAPPLDSHTYWKRLRARAHPDQGAPRICSCGSRRCGTTSTTDLARSLRASSRTLTVVGAAPGETRAEDEHEQPDRIPFDEAFGNADEFVRLTMHALSVGQTSEQPYRDVLALLGNCPADDHGRRAARQCRGASYKQLALIAHLCSWSRVDRRQWYEIAESIPLSDSHASHIIGRLKGVMPVVVVSKVL